MMGLQDKEYTESLSASTNMAFWGILADRGLQHGIEKPQMLQSPPSRAGKFRTVHTSLKDSHFSEPKKTPALLTGSKIRCAQGLLKIKDTHRP